MKLSLHSHRFTITIASLLALLLLLVVACLLLGSVDIEAGAVWCILTGGDSGNEAWNVIVLQSRLPMIATAGLAGAALAVSGLLLQTTFNNPLAGPSILGVSTGAGLGVAVVMLAMGGTLGGMFGQTLGSYVATLVGAFLGAGIVLVILIVFSSIVKSGTMLLIIGILVSYLASSIVQLLNSVATEQGVHSYVAWGFGTFSGVSVAQLPVYASLVVLCLLVAAHGEPSQRSVAGPSLCREFGR